jgi:hypothetical protein
MGVTVEDHRDPLCGGGQSVKVFCRSELAREKLIGAASIQEARAIVDVFREQARWRCTLN